MIAAIKARAAWAVDRLSEIGRLVERQSTDNPRRIVRTLVSVDQAEPARMRPGMRFRGTAETERITAALLKFALQFVAHHRAARQRLRS